MMDNNIPHYTLMKVNNIIPVLRTGIILLSSFVTKYCSVFFILEVSYCRSTASYKVCKSGKTFVWLLMIKSKQREYEGWIKDLMLELLTLNIKGNVQSMQVHAN